MMKPKITAICCTYRRHECLEEALQSFLMQDYAGEKELIILNDEPEQTLRFDHPQVRVFNINKRAPDLPSKHNYAASLATGAIITPWDDDDIYLPHRLTAIANGHKEGLWYDNLLFTDQCDEGIALAKGKAHCNHAFPKEYFIRFGAYKDGDRISFDCMLVNKVRSAADSLGYAYPKTLMPSYISRKHTGSMHGTAIYAEGSDETYETYEEKTRDFQKGLIFLKPNWSQNWSLMAANAMRTKPKHLHELDKSIKPIPALEKTT